MIPRLLFVIHVPHQSSQAQPYPLSTPLNKMPRRPASPFTAKCILVTYTPLIRCFCGAAASPGAALLEQTCYLAPNDNTDSENCTILPYALSRNMCLVLQGIGVPAPALPLNCPSNGDIGLSAENSHRSCKPGASLSLGAGAATLPTVQRDEKEKSTRGD
jgi:hypothetical protein